MKEKYVLALDQGTTSSRAIVFDKKGSIMDSQQYDGNNTLQKLRVWQMSSMIKRNAVLPESRYISLSAFSVFKTLCFVQNSLPISFILSSLSRFVKIRFQYGIFIKIVMSAVAVYARSEATLFYKSAFFKRFL